MMFKPRRWKARWTFILLLVLVVGLSANLSLWAQVDVNGRWRGIQVDSEQTESVTIDVTFTQSGTSLTGTITFPQFGQFRLSGTLSGASISFQVPLTSGTQTIATIRYSGTLVSANTITGTWVIPEEDIDGTFSLDRVTPLPTPAPAINPGGVVNSASFAGTAVAPGSIASVFGTSLAAATALAGALPLPTTLGGATLRFNDTLPVPKFFASPTQMNIQVPWELAGQTEALLTDTVGGATSTAQRVRLATFAPGIFTTTQTGSGQGAILIAATLEVAAPAGSIPGYSGRPARRGEFILIFCTGLGPVTNQPATGAPAPSDPLAATLTVPNVTVGGVSATVSFSGLAPGFVGLYQVNVQVPTNAPADTAVPVILRIGGVTSNTATMAIEPLPR